MFVQKECNCKKKLELLEGNCICTDCNCHYYKRDVYINEEDEKEEEKLQTKLWILIGTSTFFYTVYLFCCGDKIMHLLV